MTELIVPAAVLLVVLVGGLVWMTIKLNQIHVLVNSRLTAALDEIAELRRILGARATSR